MPLIETTVSAVLHICLNCGRERSIPFEDLILTAEDDSVFTTSPCDCGSQETFVFHDDLYETLVIYEEPVTIEIEQPTGKKQKREVRVRARKIELDPGQHGAMQQVLVEKVAKKLGCRQKAARPDRLKDAAYPIAPKPPKPIDVRNNTAIEMMRAGKKVLPDFLI